MREPLFDFEKLRVYQKTLDFIDLVFDIDRGLDRDYKFSVGSNLIRAALSIANNMAEGNGKKSIKEKRRYFEIALDSARECISVFNVLLRQRFITEDLYVSSRAKAREITSMMYALIESKR